MEQKNMNDIINELKEYDNRFKSICEQREKISYREGYSDGFSKAYEIAHINTDQSCIDWNSIKVFAEFCYIYGIDFSYMSKANETTTFNERVINRFNRYLKEKTL